MAAEYVQERTGEQEEIGQHAENVRPMLVPEQHNSHHGKGEEHEERARRPKATGCLGRVIVMLVIVGCHTVLLTPR
jgi:hypothetical protein